MCHWNPVKWNWHWPTTRIKSCQQLLEISLFAKLCHNPFLQKTASDVLGGKKTLCKGYTTEIELTFNAKVLCAICLPVRLSWLYDSISQIHCSHCDKISWRFNQKWFWITWGRREKDKWQNWSMKYLPSYCAQWMAKTFRKRFEIKQVAILRSEIFTWNTNH